MPKYALAQLLAPVRNTLWPLSTASTTLFCSLLRSSSCVSDSIVDDSLCTVLVTEERLEATVATETAAARNWWAFSSQSKLLKIAPAAPCKSWNNPHLSTYWMTYHLPCKQVWYIINKFSATSVVFCGKVVGERPSLGNHLSVCGTLTLRAEGT